MRRHSERQDRYLQWFCEEALSGIALRGMSGGPLLTGPPDERVAIGVVIYNELDEHGVAKGAAIWAASVATLAELWPDELNALVRSPVAVIVARPAAPDDRAHPGMVAFQDLQPETLAEELWSPVAMTWLDDRRLAVTTRGSDAVVIDRDGHQQTLKALAGWRTVAVAGARVAGTAHQYVVTDELTDGAIRRISLDTRASISSLAWRADGELLAAGGDNVLALLTPALERQGEWSVGLKHGVGALAFAGSTLWVGLGSGALWRLDPPYHEPVPVQRRPSPVIGIAVSSAADVGVIWRSGVVEVRHKDDVVYEARVEGRETWTRGNKAMWTPDARMLVWCTGVDALLTAWQPATGILWQAQLPEDVLCLAIDPAGESLALGIAERSRQDGEVLVVAVRRLHEVSPRQRMVQERPVAHLLTANWEPLLDLLTHASAGGAPAAAGLRIEVPELDEAFARYETFLEESDAEPDIKRRIRHQLQHTRARTERLPSDLLWLASAMRVIYTESAIVQTLDHALSFAVVDLLAAIGHGGYPSASQLRDWVAFTLGENEDDLVYLGFKPFRGGRIMAEVPARLLSGVDPRVGFSMPFEQVLSIEKRLRLWTTAVLPQTFVRYSRDELVINPSLIDGFGYG